MKAQEKEFLHFLEGSDKHFVIPVYQRNYDWKKEHCKQLFDDLVDISKNEKTHFLGSIVSIYNYDGNNREYLIIDGQQRLTTLSLLLLAIYKIIDKNLLQTDINKEKIKDEYLINKYSKDEKKIRLKPVKNDKSAFASLFKNDDEYIKDTNITINFQYFYDRILENKISLDKLFSAIKQLMIVEIELNNKEDDPQLIFESLNSTGLNLSEADKVRNFILMKENASTQEKFYNRYWNKIEINTNYNVSDFIRNYLTIKERAIPNKNKVYFHFKKYANDNLVNIEDLLIDLLQFSTYYDKIINSKEGKDNISLILQKINKLESAVTYPFIMEVFNDKKQGIISDNIICEILETIVSFVFRRLICEIPTNALNKIFMLLAKEMKKYNDYKENYLELFKYILINKKVTQKFPNDEEFGLKIIQKDVYNFKNRLFLLEQLENFNNKERVDVYNLLSSKELSIEHIMPQKLNHEWRDTLGKNYEFIYDKYLHTLGNITLTAYNSKMGNKYFSEKRDMEKGFKESKLFLNKGLQKVKIWNENSIKDRANILKNKALKIWVYPTSSYEIEEDKLMSFTLADDDKNFAGEKIISFNFMSNKEKNTSSWKEFYKLILTSLFELDPILFNQIIKDNNFNYKQNSSTNTSQHFKINNIYIYAILDTETLLSRLRIIVDKVGLDLDDIVFTIK